jgi:two-component system OmpR family sensor kinase
VAADAVDAAGAVDPTRRIDLSVDGSVEVFGDQLRLRQAIDNLLANVRVHTPPGTPVEVLVAADGRRASVTVSDHGPGISEEQRSHIFERFYRTDPARSRTDGGSGLGLSIVAAIATAHQGDVSVTTTPGGGARFRVRLPVLHDATGRGGPVRPIESERSLT